MARLGNLLDQPGVLAAFEFRASGELLDHELRAGSPITTGILELLASMCAANVSICGMQARGWEKLTGMSGFSNVREFTLVGFDWSVVVSCAQREAQRTAGQETLAPYQGVVLINRDARFEAACKALEA